MDAIRGKGLTMKDKEDIYRRISKASQNKIKEVAIKKGLISFENALKLDTKTCFQLAFKRNFSTEPYMKGNGLDLVKNKIKELNGKLNIKNNVNLGVSFTIQFPL